MRKFTIDACKIPRYYTKLKSCFPDSVLRSMGQYHWGVDLNEFHIFQYEYKTNDCEEIEMKYFLQQVGFIGKIRRIGGNLACKRAVRHYSWVRCG